MRNASSIKPLVHLLYFKLQLLVKHATELSVKDFFKHTSSVVVFGGFALGAFYFTRMMTSYLLEQAHLGIFLLHRFMAMMLYVFFISINVGNMIVAYATLYRSPETAFYFTKPVSHTHLFLIKFLENFFYSSSTLFIFCLSILFGYGTYFHMPWWFYPLVLVGEFIPFMLLAGCVAVILLMTLMRYAEKIDPWKTIITLVLFYFGSIYIFFEAANPMQLVNQVLQFYPHVDEYYGTLDPRIASYLPNYWIAESLYWNIKGDVVQSIRYASYLVGTVALVFTAMLWLAKKMFYASWLSSLELRAIAESRSTKVWLCSLTRAPMLEPQVSVLLRKELVQFIREPSQWVHLGIISVLIITFMISVLHLTLKSTMPLYQTLSYLVVLVFNAFLISSIALRFVFPMFSIEGESFWTILTAPIGRRKIYLLKFLVTAAPILLTSVLLAVFSHMRIQEYRLLNPMAAIIMVGTTLALVSLNLGAGAYFANFKEKNPIKAASSQSATLTFLMSIAYLSLLVGIIFIPLQKYFFYELKGGPFDSGVIWCTLAGFMLLSGGIASISVTVGLKALKRDF